MIPLFFPHTYVSGNSARSIYALFGKFNILQPSELSLPQSMKSLVESETIDVICPVNEKDDILIESVKMLHEWGNLQQIHDVSLYKAGIDKIPNYDSGSTSQIRAELEKVLHEPGLLKKSSPESSLSHASFLWWARTFLQIAQEFDASNSEINDTLSHLDQMEKTLFSDIRGERGLESSDTDVPGSIQSVDTNEYNISQRIKAWACLFRELHSYETGIFITDNCQVIEHLLEFGLISETPMCMGPIPLKSRVDNLQAWRDDLQKRLASLVTGKNIDMEGLEIEIPCTDNPDRNVFLDIFHVNDISPQRFFSDCIPENITSGIEFKTSGKLNNSIICYIYYK